METIVKRYVAIERGLNRYYTGIACPHGHICERWVSNGRCVACSRLAKARARKGEMKLHEERRVVAIIPSARFIAGYAQSGSK